MKITAGMVFFVGSVACFSAMAQDATLQSLAAVPAVQSVPPATTAVLPPPPPATTAVLPPAQTNIPSPLIALPPLPGAANAPQTAQTSQAQTQATTNNTASGQTAAPAAAGTPHQSTYGTVFDPAFQNMTKKQFPMTPEQINALRRIFQATQRASVAPVEVPTPTVSSQMVSLAPGTTPPVIKMATGYVSSIVFLDETGQPWPIANYSIGNPRAFNIQWDQNSNVLMIQGVGPYETGNMAIRLAGMPTPVMLTLVADQQKVDYRIDLRVQGRGPHAKAPLIDGTIPQKADPILMSLLEGVPPLGSQRLQIHGGPAEAWTLNSRLYLRTRLVVLSPGWEATMSSADGTKVYEMRITPVILASKDGTPITLRVEGL